MSRDAERLRNFLAGGNTPVRVTITEAKGSVPRDQGVWMLVSPRAIFGTIGGGRLEFMAIDRARLMPADGETVVDMTVPLGPEIGQCCGGHVALRLERLSALQCAALVDAQAEADRARPHIYLFGAGHVGRALVDALGLLPVNIHVVETRPDELGGLPEDVATELTPLPEAVVVAAPPGSAFIVLTHDHALDFLIVRAALARADAAYVGMIGSKTKRATFESQYRREGGDPDDCRRLVCPIGVKLKDKRPEVIAALVAAEVLEALSKPE